MLNAQHMCITLTNGHPRVNSNACQLVLKYLLLHKMKLAKAWRTRLYYYSSGTLFAAVTAKLTDWLNDNDESYLRQVCPCRVRVDHTYLLYVCVP